MPISWYHFVHSAYLYDELITYLKKNFILLNLANKL